MHSMPPQKLRNAIRVCFATLIFFGFFTAICGQVLVPVRDAARVDAILTPEELQDKRLIDVVYRTTRDESRRESYHIFTVFGVIIAVLATYGIVAMERLCKAEEKVE